MNQADVTITLCNAHVTFLERDSIVRALEGVSFEVRRGEVFGLLGPSGCGKTTTLRLLAGHFSAVDGKVRVLGRNPRRRSVRARVGCLLADDCKPSGFWRGMVRFLRDLAGTGNKAEASTSEAVTPPRSLASFRKALLGNPTVLLLDEPFAGLGAEACAEAKALIRSLAAEGKTIVLAGKNFAPGAEVCDRVALCARGCVELVGTPAQLLLSTEAVGLVAPLLSVELRQELLKLIRDRVPLPPLAQLAEAGAGRNLALDAVRASPAAVPQELATPAAPAINHEKLAALTAPSSND